MLRFISVGDIHIADKPPRSRVDPYRETVLGKLGTVREIAVKLQVHGVLLTGDIFHLSKGIRNSHSLIRAMIDMFRSFPCPCYAIPGNHDLKNDRLDSLPHQPLGVLFSSGALIQLTPEGELVSQQSGSEQVAYSHGGDPMPKGFHVKLAGADYDEDDPWPKCQEVRKSHSLLGQRKPDYLVTVGHFYSSPSGGDYYGKTCLSYTQMAESETDIYVMGHFHGDQGIQKVSGTCFIGLGSLTRGSLDEDNLRRQVKVGLIELSPDAVNIRAVRLPVKPPEEVFDLVKHEEIQNEKRAMDVFVGNLKTEFAGFDDGGNDAGPMDILTSLSLPGDVREEILRRVREAESDG